VAACALQNERAVRAHRLRLSRPWPPRSPDLTPCDFFSRGYVKDHVLVPPMPRDLPQSIVEAVAAVDRQMLQCVSQELDYRIDICRVTKRAHIEHV